MSEAFAWIERYRHAILRASSSFTDGSQLRLGNRPALLDAVAVAECTRQRDAALHERERRRRLDAMN